MKILVKKMSSFGILKAQMIFGAIVMAAVVIALPASIAANDASPPRLFPQPTKENCRDQRRRYRS